MAKQRRLSVTRLQQKAEKLLRKNELPAARAAYQKACELTPEDSDSWLALGDVNWRLNDFQAAEKAYKQALSFNHNQYQAHANLGRLAAKRGQFSLAEKHQRAYLDANPNNLRAYLELGVTLERQGKLHEPEHLYRQALNLSDQRAELHIALSRVLRQQGRLEEAKGPIERAMQMQPGFALVYREMGSLLREQKQYDAALENFQKFAKLAPQERKSILFNIGDVLTEQERYQDALSYFDAAIRETPQEADIHFTRAQLLLGLGRLEEGWREYEWRLIYSNWQQRDSFGYAALRPLWQGEPLQGKKLLVYAEQGFGDTIQFSRYLPRLTQMGATVHFHCQPELYELFASLPGVASVETIDINTPAQSGFDYYVPIMSLARFFTTSVDTIPGEAPYLHVDKQRQAYWRDKLPQDRIKVGLVWAGSGSNVRDKRRSMHPDNLAPLAQLTTIDWYGLQKWSQSQSLVKEGVPIEITDLAGDIHDFSDTAAIIKNLDLVICVDTSIAHLAGALGCPAWVLMYNGPDWRWLLEREDSPWYPSLRLFRQAPGEQWSAVVERVASALREQFIDQRLQLGNEN